MAGIYLSLQDAEIEAVEARRHPLVVQARRHGIGTFLFDDAEGHIRPRLIVGTRLAILGPENDASFTMSSDSLDSLMSEARKRLRLAGFMEDVQLHMIWDQDR